VKTTSKYVGQFFSYKCPRDTYVDIDVVFCQNGLLSGAPFICSYVASVFFCYTADKLVTKNIMSLTNVRKVMTALCEYLDRPTTPFNKSFIAAQVVPGLLVLVISYLGCDIELVLVVWFIAVTLITASYAGAMANVVDIAPNFAGPVLAFAQTIHMSASFLSPLVAFQLLNEQEHSMSAWRNVFYVTAFVAISTYGTFQIWGTSEVSLAFVEGRG
jgi:ACS family sodium-dependent inorganic phosphate cotransporter-like MFS transporter 5